MIIDKQQKLAIGFLVVMGIAALFLGFFQFKKNITTPFTLKPKTYKPPEQKQEEATLLLKTKDTDSDGISDYDELYLYKTSPYLTDSDSDGVPDGIEIKSGGDPNCPKGRDCAAPALSAPSSVSPNELAPPASPPIESGTRLLQNLTADNLRELLRQAGVSEEILSQVDDETLKAMYQDALTQAAETAK